MRKSLFVSTALAAAFAAPAHAETWYLVGEGDEDLFFADADSVSRTDGYLQVEVMDSLRDPIPNGGDHVYYFKGPVNFDCTGRQFQNLPKAALNLAHASVASTDADMNWQAIGSGTHADGLFQFACEGAFRSEAVGDPFIYAEDYWYYYYDF